MKESQRRYLEKEMHDIWKSFEYLFREKLESIDNMARAMTSEMTAMGCSREMINRFVPEAFAKLWNKVAKEQSEKYDRRTRSA